MQGNKKFHSRPTSAYNSSTTTKTTSTKLKKRPTSALTTTESINRLHSTQTRHSNSHALPSSHSLNNNKISSSPSSSPPTQYHPSSSIQHSSNNNNQLQHQQHHHHQSSHISQPSTLSPTHRGVYKRLIIDAVQTINCPILYRTLLKLEKTFQQNERAKLRFAKMVFLSACQGDQDYDPLVDFLKLQMGVCISLAECRQLVLYSGLFGDTSSSNPSKENMKQAVTSMHLHVPQLFYYHKWCRDVKRLETKMHKPTTGYFSNKWKNNTPYNTISPDISTIITNNSDEQSKHSIQSLERSPSFNQDKKEDNKTKQSQSNSHRTSSQHLAMLQAIANGEEDEEEFIPPPPKPKVISRFKKIALSLVAVGSDLSLLNNDNNNNTNTNINSNELATKQSQSLDQMNSQSSNHTPFQLNPPPKRKTGQSNVYMLSETPEYRKLVANLARGDSTVSPTGEILGSASKDDGRSEWNFFSNKESYDGDEVYFLSNPSPLNSGGGSGGGSGSGNNGNKMEVNIFNIRGDPIKDGYYVNAASHVEVLNFLDPKYVSGSLSFKNETMSDLIGSEYLSEE